MVGSRANAASSAVPWGRHLTFSTEKPCHAAVIWLHGWGDGPEGWADCFAEVRRANPEWSFIHLRGRRLRQTGYRGMLVPGWGDYHEDGCTNVGSKDYDNEDNIAAETVGEVHRIVSELEQQGIASERVVIGGFSQGATAAGECALRYPKRLAGLIMLNGWLTPAARAALSNASVPDLPVLVSHGSVDDQVGFDCGTEAARLLEQAGASVTFEVQDGEGHVDSGFGKGKILAMKFFRSVL